MSGKNLGPEDMKGKKKALNNYAYYSGIGFQMIAIIGIFAFIGHKLDEWQSTKMPVYTAGLCLVGVFASMYLIIKSLKKDKF